jgi:hypothetical protein
VSVPRSETVPEACDLEGEADAAIAACGGDARAAVKALLVANSFLEREAGRLARAVSFGFTRRKSSAARHASEKLDGWREIAHAADRKIECRDGSSANAKAPSK